MRLASRGISISLALEVERLAGSPCPVSGKPETDPRVPLWGAPRIHGELLKLGIDVGQTSVVKYMVRKRRPPSQGWKTFLRNHADGIVAMDLFVVPTVSFRVLYGLLISGGIFQVPHDSDTRHEKAGSPSRRHVGLAPPGAGDFGERPAYHLSSLSARSATRGHGSGRVG